jgi:hypothetical protein
MTENGDSRSPTPRRKTLRIVVAVAFFCAAGVVLWIGFFAKGPGYACEETLGPRPSTEEVTEAVERWKLADGLPAEDAATVAEFALRLAGGMTEPHAVSKIEVLAADRVFVETEASVHATPYGMNYTLHKEDAVWTIAQKSNWVQ